MDRQALLVRVAVRWALGLLVLGAMLFLPAGTWRFWAGWVYCGVVFIPMAVAVAYFRRRDPALLERRMQTREREPEQRMIMSLATLAVVAGFLTPGFDYRFGWSHVGDAVILGSNALVLAGYLATWWVMRENSYASRVIQVEEGQRLVSTGPYAIVRHPMYAAAIVMTVFTPTALGSYWALIPFLLLPPLLVFRTRNEEKVLREQLPGYVEYCDAVRHRLVPGVW